MQVNLCEIFKAHQQHISTSLDFINSNEKNMGEDLYTEIILLISLNELFVLY